MKETWMHITKWKKPTWKGYILYDSNSKTFWRRENYGNSKEVSDNQRLSVGEVGDEQAEHRVFLGQWKYSVWNHNVGYRSLTFSQTYRVDNIKSEP